MKDTPATDAAANELVMTGLRWPKTWNGAYLFVIGNFILWVVMLVALTELCR